MSVQYFHTSVQNRFIGSIINEERKQLEQVDRCVRRAASIGVDTREFNPKTINALMALFQAIDQCESDAKKYRSEAAKYRINPTNLERYGISRSTINSNQSLRKIVKHYEDVHDGKYVTIVRSELETLRADLEKMKTYNENAINIGMENMRLQNEIDDLRRRNEQLEESYSKLASKQMMDFNELLKTK